MNKWFDNFNEAEKYFHEIKKNNQYVCLLYSSHPYSEGYWVELNSPTNLYGTVINIHDIVDIRDDKIDEIINEKKKKDTSI